MKSCLIIKNNNNNNSLIKSEIKIIFLIFINRKRNKKFKKNILYIFNNI